MWTDADQHTLDIDSKIGGEYLGAGFVFRGPGCLFTGASVYDTQELSFSATKDVVIVMLSWSPSSPNCSVFALATDDITITVALAELVGSPCKRAQNLKAYELFRGEKRLLGTSI